MATRATHSTEYLIGLARSKSAELASGRATREEELIAELLRDLAARLEETTHDLHVLDRKIQHGCTDHSCRECDV